MRYYKPITLGDFKSKIEPIFEHFDEEYEFPATITKDLAKVNFDFENRTTPDDDSGFVSYPVGYKMMGENFPVLFVNAGGDWEFPICFVMYWDGKQVRAYIPKEGNAYNKKEKTAYGSEDNPNEDIGDDEEPGEVYAKQINVEEIYKDVLNRIIEKK